MEAALTGSAEGIIHLLNKGADVTVRVALFVVRATPPPPPFFFTLWLSSFLFVLQKSCPIAAAAQNGHVNCIWTLARRGADVNKGMPNGQTPLSYACVKGHPNCVKALLSLGADLDHTWGVAKITAVAAAAQHGTTECLRLLIAKGADVNKPLVVWSPPPLHTARCTACLRVVMSSCLVLPGIIPCGICRPGPRL